MRAREPVHPAEFLAKEPLIFDCLSIVDLFMNFHRARCKFWIFLSKKAPVDRDCFIRILLSVISSFCLGASYWTHGGLLQRNKSIVLMDVYGRVYRVQSNGPELLFHLTFLISYKTKLIALPCILAGTSPTTISPTHHSPVATRIA